MGSPVSGIDRSMYRSPSAFDDEYRLRKVDNTKSMEMAEIMADERSVSLLRSQLTQVKTIKYENERKDEIIASLRNQVSDLLRYKEQTQSLKLRIDTLEERLKIREAEATQANLELRRELKNQEHAMKTLREQLIETEKARLEAARKHAAQLLDVESGKKALHHEVDVAQGKLQAANAEIDALRHKSRTLELTLEEARKLAGAIEGQLGDERRRLHDEADRNRVLELEAKKREREAQTAEETIRALTDAHRAAAERTLELERLLFEARREASEYRVKLQGAEMELGNVLDDRQRSARQRLEVLSLRQQAEEDLRHALEAPLSYRSAYAATSPYRARK
eukprot:tig00000241_g21010.t1